MELELAELSYIDQAITAGINIQYRPHTSPLALLHLQPVRPQQPMGEPGSMSPTVALLHRCSWQAEKLFKQRGHFRSMLWLTECSDGRRERSETDCGVSPEDASDLEVLTALVAEMRADFARDGVVRFAVAYPARAHGILNPLHDKPQTRAVDVVTIEAHDVDANSSFTGKCIGPPAEYRRWDS